MLTYIAIIFWVLKKNRLIETGFLSTHTIRGHIFCLKIIKDNIPILDFLLSFKDKSFTMVSFIIMKEGTANPRIDVENAVCF